MERNDLTFTLLQSINDQLIELAPSGGLEDGACITNFNCACTYDEDLEATD